MIRYFEENLTFYLQPDFLCFNGLDQIYRTVTGRVKIHILNNSFIMCSRYYFIDASKGIMNHKLDERNKGSECNSCNQKKEIVFEKEGFILCNDCLDEFMKNHRFTK
jgi:hypothetical protein